MPWWNEIYLQWSKWLETPNVQFKIVYIFLRNFFLQFVDTFLLSEPVELKKNIWCLTLQKQTHLMNTTLFYKNMPLKSTIAERKVAMAHQIWKFPSWPSWLFWLLWFIENCTLLNCSLLVQILESQNNMKNNISSFWTVNNIFFEIKLQLCSKIKINS